MPRAMTHGQREKRYLSYQDDWKLMLHNDIKFPKLCTYKLIKRDYRIEPHILYVTNKRHQRALTRLRVSSHKLQIEIGRHSRPPTPRTERVCKFCNIGVLDDEIHFLLNCSFHTHERESLIKEIRDYYKFDENPSLQSKFIDLMTSKNQAVISALAKYTYNAFKNRDQYMR